MHSIAAICFNSIAATTNKIIKALQAHSFFSLWQWLGIKRLFGKQKARRLYGNTANAVNYGPSYQKESLVNLNIIFTTDKELILFCENMHVHELTCLMVHSSIWSEWNFVSHKNPFLNISITLKWCNLRMIYQ